MCEFYEFNEKPETVAGDAQEIESPIKFGEINKANRGVLGSYVATQRNLLSTSREGSLESNTDRSKVKKAGKSERNLYKSVETTSLVRDNPSSLMPGDLHSSLDNSRN